MSAEFACCLDFTALTKLVEVMKDAADGAEVTVEDGPNNWYCTKEAHPNGKTTVTIRIYKHVRRKVAE